MRKCVGSAGDESVWASGRVGEIPRRVGVQGPRGWLGTCRRGQQRLVGWELLGWETGNPMCCKTWAAGCPSGFARQDRRSIAEGCLTAISEWLSRAGKSSGSQLNQPRRDPSAGILPTRRHSLRKLRVPDSMSECYWVAGTNPISLTYNFRTTLECV